MHVLQEIDARGWVGFLAWVHFNVRTVNLKLQRSGVPLLVAGAKPVRWLGAMIARRLSRVMMVRRLRGVRFIKRLDGKNVEFSKEVCAWGVRSPMECARSRSVHWLGAMIARRLSGMALVGLCGACCFRGVGDQLSR